MATKTYEYRKSNGFCVDCGSILDREGTRCTKCSERAKEYHRNRRIEFKKLNRCPICGKKKTFESTVSCIDCRDRISDVYYEKDLKHEYMRRNNERRNKRRDNRLCTKCGEELKQNYPYVTCEKCRNKSNLWAKKKRMSQPGYLDRSEYPNYGLCYICGREELYDGHKVCKKCYDLQLIKLSKAWDKARNENAIYQNHNR